MDKSVAKVNERSNDFAVQLTLLHVNTGNENSITVLR